MVTHAPPLQHSSTYRQCVRLRATTLNHQAALLRQATCETFQRKTKHKRPEACKVRQAAASPAPVRHPTPQLPPAALPAIAQSSTPACTYLCGKTNPRIR